jgi:hypothetical protein
MLSPLHVQRQIEPARYLTIATTFVAYELGSRVASTWRELGSLQVRQHQHLDAWRMTGVGQCISDAFAVMRPARVDHRPVHTEDAFDARVVNRSKNTGYLECDVTDPDGKRVAKATSTCMVLRGEQAKIR